MTDIAERLRTMVDRYRKEPDYWLEDDAVILLLCEAAAELTALEGDLKFMMENYFPVRGMPRKTIRDLRIEKEKRLQTEIP